jgi:hypothetical protein
LAKPHGTATIAWGLVGQPRREERTGGKWKANHAQQQS